MGSTVSKLIGVKVDFDLSEDQEMLKAVAERFIQDRYDPERRRAYVSGEYGFSAENWSLLAELGLIGAAFEEASGGLGLDSASIAIIYEALGQGMSVEPLIENVILAGKLFESLAQGALREAWLPRIVSGEMRLAVAHKEAKARHNPDWVETRAVANGTGLYLNGAKSAVPAGHGVDAFIVTARVAGESGAREGVQLFLVDANAPGLTKSSWRMVDGSVGVSLDFRDVFVPSDQCLGGDLSDLDRAQTLASLVRAAEAVGIMQRLFDDTLDYLKTRKQFGTAIGNFQAIQHRMVAQYAVIEQARGLLALAMMTSPANFADFARKASGARAFIARASVQLGHEMIQFHGGMGVTEELAIGHGHKRLLMLSRWPDDADAALDRYAG
jgi:alkylation response protein AidB-like acyl-CoA dehydrogenase